jgi:hypothetical protein
MFDLYQRLGIGQPQQPMQQPGGGFGMFGQPQQQPMRQQQPYQGFFGWPR